MRSASNHTRPNEVIATRNTAATSAAPAVANNTLRAVPWWASARQPSKITTPSMPTAGRIAPTSNTANTTPPSTASTCTPRQRVASRGGQANITTQPMAIHVSTRRHGWAIKPADPLTIHTAANAANTAVTSPALGVVKLGVDRADGVRFS